MPGKFIAGAVTFAAVGTLGLVMFFTYFGSGNASGVGVPRALGLDTSTVGLIGAVCGYGLAIYVLVFGYKNRRR